MRPANSLIINALPANANQTSKVVWAWDILRCSVQLVSTGTAAGTLQLQGSNDIAVGLPKDQFVPTNWSNIGAALTVAGPAAQIIPYIETSYEYLRVTYTDTSSGAASGTISARMSSKAL